MAQAQSAAVRRNQNALKKAVAKTKEELKDKKIEKTIYVYPKGLWAKTRNKHFKEALKTEKKTGSTTKRKISTTKKKTTTKAKKATK